MEKSPFSSAASMANCAIQFRSTYFGLARRIPSRSGCPSTRSHQRFSQRFRAGVGLAALVEGVGHVAHVRLGDGAEVAEEERHVDFGGAQQVEQVVHERLVGFLQRAEAQLFGPRFALGVHGELHVVVQDRLQAPHVVHEGRHGFEQTSHVPRPDVRLVGVAVASTTGVGGVGRPVDVKGFEPAVGAVVDGEPVNRHVVGVHHAVNEADAHPVGDHRRRGFGHLGQPRDETVVGAGIVIWEMVLEGVINERP